MEIIIDKTKLEQNIPTFANPDNQIFDLISTYLTDEAERVSTFIGQCKTASQTAAEKLVCFRAARHALPQLDVVMTPNGIGVVRNAELAPASKERVEALMENLRQNASLWEDDLTISMMNDAEWCATEQAAAVIDSLIWCPFLARQYGMKAPDGKEVYHEEFTALQTSILMAESQIARVVSQDFLEALIDFEREHMAMKKHDEKYKLYGKAMVRAKRLIAAIVMNNDDDQKISTLFKSFLEFVQNNESQFPEYANSSLRKSNSIRYENKKDSPCFFFG